MPAVFDGLFGRRGLDSNNWEKKQNIMKWFSDKRRVRRVDPINFVGNLMTPDFGTMWKISLLNSLGSLPIAYIVYRNTWLNRKRADSSGTFANLRW